MKLINWTELNNSILARIVASHVIIRGRCGSRIGRNALLCMRRYGVTQSKLLSGRRIDEFICMGHSTEEITAEQERSADYFYRSVLCCETMLSHYRLITQELILNWLSSTCADEINFVDCIACLLYFCMHICMCVPHTNKIIIIIIICNSMFALLFVFLHRKPTPFYGIAIAELRSVTWYMGSRSVTWPATRHRWPQPCRPVFDLPTPKGWKAELILVLVIYRYDLPVDRRTVAHPSSNQTAVNREPNSRPFDS